MSPGEDENSCIAFCFESAAAGCFGRMKFAAGEHAGEE